MKDLRDELNMFSASNHLTKDQLVRYHLRQMAREERHAVESHLVDCELCKDALSGMTVMPGYKGIDKIRQDLRKLAKPKQSLMNQVAWRNVILTAAVLSLILLAALHYIYFTGNAKKTRGPMENKQTVSPAAGQDSAVIKKR